MAFSYNGYEDWYIPSLDEMKQIRLSGLIREYNDLFFTSSYTNKTTGVLNASDGFDGDVSSGYWVTNMGVTYFIEITTLCCLVSPIRYF